MAFYKELVDIEKQLEAKGFTVNIPVSAQIMKKKNDFDVSHFKGVFTHKQKGEFILTNFQEIAKGDSILVVNGEKNGIKGYIGANVLMEIGLAFYLGKKIYIWKPIEEYAPHKEELLAFDATFINKDLTIIPHENFKNLTKTDDGHPPFDDLLANLLINKHVIVGYTYNNTDGSINRYEQKHGIVIKVDEKKGIGIRLHNSDEVIWLPPDLRAWKPTPRGSYELTSTGEVVIDPDYYSAWIIDPPDSITK